MVKIPAGAFLAMSGKGRGVFIEGNGKSRLLLWPYWYHMQRDNEAFILEYIGKSGLELSTIYDEGGVERAESAQLILEDLYFLFEWQAVETEVQNLLFPMCRAMLPKLGQKRVIDMLIANDGFVDEGDYVTLFGHLYNVGPEGKFNLVGKLQQKVPNTSDFIKGLARLTGVIAVNIDSDIPRIMQN